MKPLTGQALACALWGVLGAAGNAAASPSCYRAAQVNPPAVVSHTVVVIDTTTPDDSAAVTGFREAVFTVAATANERVSLVTFAGLAPGQTPKTLIDFVNEPDPDEELIERLDVATGKRLRACARKTRADNRALLAQAMTRNIAPPDRSSGDFSEIVWSLRWVGQHYGGAQRWLIFSDGYEHSREIKYRRSFYAAGKPRVIEPANELAQVAKAGLASGLPAPPAKVRWFGLGARAVTAEIAYTPPSEFDALQAFWTSLLYRWGATDVAAALALPDALTERSGVRN